MIAAVPNTQPATDSEPFSQLSQKIVQPWAVLIPYNTRFVESTSTYELTEDTFKFGRDVVCDKTCLEKEFPAKIFPQISKVHFIIKRLSINGTHVTTLEDTSSNGTYVNGESVGKSNTVVLTDKDVISICPIKFKVFEFNDLRKEVCDEIPSAVKMCYSILKMIGKGGFGAVYHVLKKRTTAPYAMKEIQLAHDHDHGPNEFAEIEVLRKIEEHDNIIKLYDYMLVEKKIFLLLDYMPGGDLGNYLASKKKLNEPVAKYIFHQIASGCAYLHSKKIVHRDIKPPNILLKDADDEYPTVKITDFGLSRILKRDETDIHTICGTRNFKAPELINPSAFRTFDDRVDVWALGVLLYLCLCGKFPFATDANKPSLEHQIIRANYEYAPVEIWNKISIQAKYLIKRCLVKNWRSRIRAKEICSDPWFVYDSEFRKRRTCQNENDCPVDVPAKKLRNM